MKEQVLNFINRFTFNGEYQEVINSFSCGCCYWFATILLKRFSFIENACIMYDPIENHFGCSIDGSVYDIHGDVTNKYEWESWNFYAAQDEFETSRIYRDCINF